MNIEEKIKGILADLSGETEISGDTTLQSDLDLDSLALVTLLVEIEDAFGIQFDEADMNPFDFETVQSVIDTVKKYIGDENEGSC